LLPTVTLVRYLPCAVVFLTVAGLGEGKAAAQRPTLPREYRSTRISISVKKAAMSAILTELSSQAGKAVVADGEAIKTDITFAFDGSLMDALDRIGDTFDYSWRVSRYGTILMNKRFKTNVDERPQMNRDEMRQMAAHVLRTLRSLPYDLDPADPAQLAKRVLDSMTPEQTSLLRSGRHLSGKDLQPQQREFLAAYRCNRTFGPLYAVWSGLSDKLEAMPKAELQLREYAAPYVLKDGRVVVPLNNPTALSCCYVYSIHGRVWPWSFWSTPDAAAWRNSLEH